MEVLHTRLMRSGLASAALMFAVVVGATHAASTNSPDVASAHSKCLEQARAGTRSPSTHAKSMSAACDALAAQASQGADGRTVAELATVCRDEAGKGHPPGASPYKRQFRDMHKMRSRRACSDLADAVLAGAVRTP